MNENKNLYDVEITYRQPDAAGQTALIWHNLDVYYSDKGVELKNPTLREKRFIPYGMIACMVMTPANRSDQ